MGLFTNLLNAFRRVDKRYSSFTFGQVAPVYPDPKVDTFIKDAYSGNASVYSIINLPARKFSFIPRYLMKIEDEESVKKYKNLTRGYVPIGALIKSNLIKKKAYTQPKGKLGDPISNLEKLLQRPNDAQGQDAFFFDVYLSYKIAGEAFVWLNRGDIKDLEDDSADKLPVLEMIVLPPNLMEIIADDRDPWGVLGYQIQLDGQLKTIRKNDIIHWKTSNPNFDNFTRDHQRGLAPLVPGNKALTQDEDSTDAAVAMYQNGGARGVLSDNSLKNVTVTQKAHIEEIVSKRISNKDMKSAVVTLQGDWKYQDIGYNSVDMQLLEGNDKAFAKLCHVFGVPPGLFLVDQTYENMRSNRKRLVSELVIPDCTSFNDEMNRMLLPAFGLKGYEIEPDYSELPEMQEDMKDTIDLLSKAPVTPNEIREVLGYDPLTIDGMDSVFIPSGMKRIDELDMGIETPPEL